MTAIASRAITLAEPVRPTRECPARCRRRAGPDVAETLRQPHLAEAIALAVEGELGGGLLGQLPVADEDADTRRLPLQRVEEADRILGDRLAGGKRPGIVPGCAGGIIHLQIDAQGAVAAGRGDVGALGRGMRS